MKKLVLAASIVFLLIPSLAFTHPGRTASDGCHYCRTNCDKWGVPWGARHCHGRMEEPVLLKIKEIVEESGESKRENKKPGWEYFKRVHITGIEFNFPDNED